jgi:hypothetical protein
MIPHFHIYFTLKGKFSKNTKYFSPLYLTAFCLSFFLNIEAQTVIKGKIVYADNSPAAFVSLSLKHKSIGKLADKLGKFKFYIPENAMNDTLMISSIGHRTLSLSVFQASKMDLFTLEDSIQNMGIVSVSGYRTARVVGSYEESAAYLRSWNTANTGGEIGREFTMPEKPYILEKVRFKISNRCDSCLIRLHIRKMQYSNPGEELLKDSISIIVINQSLDEKSPEFDLAPYNIELKNKFIFVGMEVLHCNSVENPSNCSLCFVGTEHGSYLYKTGIKNDWDSFNDYNIYMKLFYSTVE